MRFRFQYDADLRGEKKEKGGKRKKKKVVQILRLDSRERKKRGRGRGGGKASFDVPTEREPRKGKEGGGNLVWDAECIDRRRVLRRGRKKKGRKRRRGRGKKGEKPLPHSFHAYLMIFFTAKQKDGGRGKKKKEKKKGRRRREPSSFSAHVWTIEFGEGGGERGGKTSPFRGGGKRKGPLVEGGEAS